MRAVDTNVVVRLIIDDDARQVKAAESFASQGVWISHLVLAETCWVLSSRIGPAQIANAVDKLLAHDKAVIQDADIVRRALEQFRKRPALGFSDCLIVEIARKNGHLPIGTFDRNMAKLEGVERL